MESGALYQSNSTGERKSSPDVYLTKPVEVKGFVQTIRSLLKMEPQVQA